MLIAANGCPFYGAYAGKRGEAANVCSGRMLVTVEATTGHSMQVEVNTAFVRVSEVQTLYGDPLKLRSLIGQWETLYHWMRLCAGCWARRELGGC